MATYRTRRRVEFRDTDAACIMHFSTFLTYMEEAEHELLRHLGIGVVIEQPQGAISWPRVAVSCEFSGSVRFEEVFDVEVEISRIGTKSVTYQFRFFKGDQQFAHGQITTVCCHVESGKTPQSMPIPAEISKTLRDWADS